MAHGCQMSRWNHQGGICPPLCFLCNWRGGFSRNLKPHEIVEEENRRVANHVPRQGRAADEWAEQGQPARATRREHAHSGRDGLEDSRSSREARPGRAAELPSSLLDRCARQDDVAWRVSPTSSSTRSDRRLRSRWLPCYASELWSARKLWSDQPCHSSQLRSCVTTFGGKIWLNQPRYDDKIVVGGNHGKVDAPW